MSEESPRALRKQATRAALQAAALRCFRERGYAASRIRDIAAEAGVAPGTFYVHFSSKEALVDELLADLNDRVATRMAPAFVFGAVSPRRRLARVARIFLDTWGAERALVEAVVQRMAEGLSPEAIREGVNPPATALVERLLRAEIGDRGLTRLVTQGLLSLWLRIGLQALFNPEVDREQAIFTLVHMTLGAVEEMRRATGEEEGP